MMILSRERSHIPPNGKRKIIDSKVPIGRGCVSSQEGNTSGTVWYWNPVNSPVKVGSWSHYLPRFFFLHPRWCRISSSNSINFKMFESCRLDTRDWKNTLKKRFLHPLCCNIKQTKSTLHHPTSLFPVFYSCHRKKTRRYKWKWKLSNSKPAWLWYTEEEEVNSIVAHCLTSW